MTPTNTERENALVIAEVTEEMNDLERIPPSPR